MLKIISFISTRFHKLFSKKPPVAPPMTPSETHLSQEQHQLLKQQTHPQAVGIIQRLHKAGYEAYLVGGCVRDILLGHSPKDFDLATSAHPEQVKKHFRNCRLIGRRFRLAHIFFGRHIIEVATFRAPHDNADQTQAKSRKGMLVRDNVYGTLDDDVLRRDFSINALYYDSEKGILIDYLGGLEDLERKVLRVIGDPEKRYAEDPVRMLRAIRIAAKLDFSIEEKTAKPIKKLAPLLGNISNSRLFDEMQKLFLTGHALKTYHSLRDYHLFEQLFPLLATETLAKKYTNLEKFIEQAFKNSDGRIAQNKSITPAFILACLLWFPMQDLAKKYREEKMPPLAAMEKAISETLREQSQTLAIPRYYSSSIRDIWLLQYRLPRRLHNKAYQLLQHQRFRAGYDFLLLRAQCGEKVGPLADWWTKFQDANETEKADMLKKIQTKQVPRKS